MSPSQLGRFEQLKKVFTTKGCAAYCVALIADDDLFQRPAKFKQSTVRSFAESSVDGPLCDQLCFLFDWLNYTNQRTIVLNDGPIGAWFVDSNGFSGVQTPEEEPSPFQKGITAIQPKLRDASDEDVLLKLSDALKTYFLRHLSQFEGVTVHKTQSRSRM